MGKHHRMLGSAYATFKENIVVISFSLILHKGLSPALGPCTLLRNRGYLPGLLQLFREKVTDFPLHFQRNATHFPKMFLNNLIPLNYNFIISFIICGASLSP